MRSIGCLVAVLSLAMACQPRQDHAAAEKTHQAARAPASAAAPPRPSQASSPLELAAPVPAPARDLPADGFIEIQQDGKVTRLDGECQYGVAIHDPKPGPYAEVLDPNTSKPRFVLTSCGADNVHFDIVGTTLQLPGPVQVMRVRFQDPVSGEEWTSESARLEVDTFGDVARRVEGTFEARMGARLNRPAVEIRGRFSVPRARDRYAP